MSPKIRKGLFSLSWIIVAILVAYGIKLGYGLEWTGFDGAAIDQERAPAKTLWDWLDLLVVPLAIALIALVFKRKDRKEKEMIELDRQRQSTLDVFFERMTQLMLEKKLMTSERHSEVRRIARTQALAAFRSLNVERKAQCLQFLVESGLVNSDPILDLNGADLEGAELSKARLVGVDIRGAYWRKARLEDATINNARLAGNDFTSANLSRAMLTNSDMQQAFFKNAKLKNVDLSGSNLTLADFSGANLRGAIITSDQLASCILDKRTKLPKPRQQSKDNA